MIVYYLFIYFATLQSSDYILAEEICQTLECKELADELLHRSMNHSVNPCDDFYQYVCGNWAKHHPLDHGKTMTSSFSIRADTIEHEINDAINAAAQAKNKSHAVHYLAQFYLECNQTETLNSRGVHPLSDTITSVLGEWPLLGKGNSSSKLANQTKDWKQLYIDIYSEAALSPIFRIGVIAYLGKKTVYITPSGSGMDVQLLAEGDLAKGAIAAYKSFIRDSAIMLGATDNEKLTHDIDQFVQLEISLAKAIANPKRPPGTPPRTLSFAALNKATHNRVDWLTVINSILIKIGSKLPYFLSTEEILIDHLDAIVDLLHILDGASLESIHNLFGWTLVMQYGKATTDKMREYQTTFRKNISSVEEDISHADFCYQTSYHLLPFALSRIYVDAHSTPQDKKEATILVNEIKSSFRRSMENNTWLDDETRAFALEKLDSIRDNVAYPDWVTSDTGLDQYYSMLNGLEVPKGKFFESAVQLFKLSLRDQFDKLPFPYNHSLIWLISPATANAIYIANENSITIPMSMLKSPFFDKNRPFSMNYGAIGAIIGHEYTHGFDNLGRQFDLDGRSKNWWTYETAQKFDQKAKCFVEQYGKIEVPETNRMHINGNRTLGENIADNGGIKESFSAFRTHEAKYGSSSVLPGLKHNAEQLFFISFAKMWCGAIKPDMLQLSLYLDPHSPNQYRVNVVLGNTPQFAQAFQCPASSRMNPTNKCALW